MKKELLLLIFSLLLSGMSVHGQDSLSFLSQKRFGITLQLNSPNPDEVNVGWFNIDTESLDDHNLLHKSFSLGAALHYRLDKETTLRLRFARGTTHVEEYQEEVYDPRMDEYRREFMAGHQVKLQIAPSVIWELGSGRLRFFAGFELPVNLHGDYEFKSAATVLDGNRQFKYEAESVIVLPKGYSVGIGAVSGFNYYLTRALSMGAEFSPSLLYARLSGKTRNKDAAQMPPDRDYLTRDENRGFTFYEQRFSLNLSHRFNF